MSQIPVFFNRICISHSKKIVKEINQNRRCVSRKIYTSYFLSKNVSFNLSDIGEGIREVLVKEWFVKIGDKVAQFDNICEVQSDKASVTITSRYDGVITKLYYKIDDTALVGQPLVNIDTDEKDGISCPEEIVLPKPDLHVPEIKERPIETSGQNTALCIPSVRRIAKQHNIDLSKVQGSGKSGRILKEDILKYVDDPSTKVVEQSLNRIPSGTVNFEDKDDKVEPIKGFTKAMVKTMTESLKIPHFVYSDEIKVTKLAKLRRNLKNLPELRDIKRYPIINASVDEKCENIIYHKHHNIGIAMDTNAGLVVPVIKNVENLSIMEVAKELNKFIKSGKSGTFSPSDLSGATFSISNIGVVGGTYTKPVILSPQVSIIAIGMTQVVPRFDESMKVIAEEIINISGSADHRVVDGVSMANFIKVLKKQIENPNLMFLNL